MVLIVNPDMSGVDNSTGIQDYVPCTAQFQITDLSW